MIYVCDGSCSKLIFFSNEMVLSELSSALGLDDVLEVVHSKMLFFFLIQRKERMSINEVEIT